MQDGGNHPPFASNVRRAWCCNVYSRERRMWLVLTSKLW